jgi:hypothetical protein
MSALLRSGDPDQVSFELDLLRGDLYRILDALVRAGPHERDGLVFTFEETWRRFLGAVSLPH